MLNKLVFDTTDADTILDSANVGAYLRSADGTLLTHTDVGGKKALDVRVAEGINVEVDLDAADDSVASWTKDGAGNAIGSVSDALKVSLTNASIAVTATDLDIRNLVFATDKVDASGSVVALDAGTLAALESITVQNGAGAAAVNIQDGGNSITVDGTVAVSSISGTVAVTQSTSPWVVSGSVSATVNDAALANTAIAAGKTVLAVANTAQDAVASPLAARKYLWLMNYDKKTMYVGQSGIDADGYPIPPGSEIQMRAGAAIDIEFVSAQASHDLRYLQLS